MSMQSLLAKVKKEKSLFELLDCVLIDLCCVHQVDAVAFSWQRLLAESGSFEWLWVSVSSFVIHVLYQPTGQMGGRCDT